VDQQAHRRNQSDPGATLNSGRLSGSPGVTPFLKVTGLDQTVGRPASVHTARHRQGECGVWPARDRLQPEPTEQSAQPSAGGGMNSQLPRGVANCKSKSLENRPNGPHPALCTALRAEISKKSAFGWGKLASWLVFSANT
jgi:hypothetical protein